MKKWIGIALFVLLIALLVNDFGRYMRAVYNLNNEAREVSQAGAAAASHTAEGRISGLSAARKAAVGYGLNIVAYKADRSTGVTVIVRSYVSGTWVVGPFTAWRAKQPLSTPLAMESQSTSQLQ